MFTNTAFVVRLTMIVPLVGDIFTINRFVAGAGTGVCPNRDDPARNQRQANSTAANLGLTPKRGASSLLEQRCCFTEKLFTLICILLFKGLCAMEVDSLSSIRSNTPISRRQHKNGSWFAWFSRSMRQAHAIEENSRMCR